MDQFRTIVEIPKSNLNISYHSKILMIGSCFVENIGKLLIQNKFNTSVNPFGVIYNPISIGNSLRFLIEKKEFADEDLNFANERYFSYYHHSSFSAATSDQCLQGINEKIQSASADLASADILFITFGTSWVYELIDSGVVVSNCHKQPAKIFNRYRVDIDEVVSLYKDLILSLSLLNPQLKIVFTVSPIRHWKDGAHENQLSKSVLLLAIDQLVQLFDQVSYFPSYEIIMDELRDYRFYSEDMIHVSTSAVNYIWSRFVDCYTDQSTREYMKRINKLILAAWHRPFNPDSDTHRIFVENTFAKMEELEKQLPNLSFELERRRMHKNLLK